MAEWLVEDGIGEQRALFVDHGTVLAAQVAWPGELAPGEVREGKLVGRATGSGRGRVRFANGEEALATRLGREISQGATLRCLVTRSAMGEAGRSKLAQVRPTSEPCCPAPSLAERLGARVVHRFPKDAWEDLWTEAADGTVPFKGGALVFSPTPAMTLVDIDGDLSPRDLALAAVVPLARAIARFGLGGSIGVDFPTLSDKGDRKAVDGALGVALADWDHERTAMNGFGFVQLVARLEAPSLLHRLQFARAGAAARLLLRRAEMLEGAGAIELAAHPAVLAHLHDAWLAELQRRGGREVIQRPDSTLALAAPQTQMVAR